MISTLTTITTANVEPFFLVAAPSGPARTTARLAGGTGRNGATACCVATAPIVGVPEDRLGEPRS